jgi:hypothetical protein
MLRAPLRSAGPFLYTPEWHSCRAALHSPATPGCYVRSEHYYPVHLNYRKKTPPPSRIPPAPCITHPEATTAAMGQHGREGGADAAGRRGVSRGRAASPPIAEGGESAGGGGDYLERGGWAREQPSPMSSEGSSPAPRGGPPPRQLLAALPAGAMSARQGAYLGPGEC